MTELEQLKKMVKEWEKQKALSVAYDICEFLASNLDLEKRMNGKVLGTQCRKCHNVIPLTVGHNIYCPNCKALMVVANLVATDKEEE